MTTVFQQLFGQRTNSAGNGHTKPRLNEYEEKQVFMALLNDFAESRAGKKIIKDLNEKFEEFVRERTGLNN